MASRRRTVADAGEARLIAMIRRAVERSRLGDVASLGDDAAILPKPRGRGRQVVTTDVLVEGTHWRESHLTPTALGRRALVVNLSDIAAMAARPLWFTLGLGMPPQQSLDWFRGLLRGLLRAGDQFGCPLVGGDLVRSPVAMISITVCGQAVGKRLCRRDAARVGDGVWVTGDLGRARLALEFLESKRPERDCPAGVLARHRSPTPRLPEAAALAKAGVVHAMMDVSDGLQSDLGWISRLSHVGARVDLDMLPLRSGVRRAIESQGQSAGPFAAASGEEFELLFTSNAEETAIRQALTRAGLRTPVTRIGEIISATTRGGGVQFRREGRAVKSPPDSGFAHFS
jgi:thiamine-monophosphate kinase